MYPDATPPRISHIISERSGMPLVTEVDGVGISPQELANHLGVHRMTVLKYIGLGEIRAVRFGRRWRVPPEEVQRVLREGYSLRQRVVDEETAG